MKNPDNAAFPFTYYNSDGSPDVHTQCLTKREYAAIKAMQGILSKEGWAERISSEGDSTGCLRNQITTASIRIADELLAKLED